MPNMFLSNKDTRRQLKRIRKRHIRNQLAIAKELQGDRPQKCAFLSAFSETGNVQLSCRAAGIPSSNYVRKWKKRDDKFLKYYNQAEEFAIANLEAEARRRAVEGTQKLVTYKGQPVYVPKNLFDKNSELVPLIERQYSDDLLKMLLRAHLPNKYRENINVTSQGAPISYKQIKNLKGVSADDL